jgi:hypothetical protein
MARSAHAPPRTTLKLSTRKPRTRSQKDHFSELFYKSLSLNTLAESLRNKFIADNPELVKDWLQDPLPSVADPTAKNPIAHVIFRNQAIAQAWSQATPEQIAAVEKAVREEREQHSAAPTTLSHSDSAENLQSLQRRTWVHT